MQHNNSNNNNNNKHFIYTVNAGVGIKLIWTK